MSTNAKERPCKTSLDIYFSEPAHRRWESHYEGDDAAVWLTFTGPWADAYLPADREIDGGRPYLRIVLLDTSDGKTYETRMWARYEDANAYHEPDFSPEPVRRLHLYFYEEHHCPCHRASDAADAGADTSDQAECTGNRFLIGRIESFDLPGLVLYSETLNQEDLEHSLTPGLTPAS